MAEATVNVRCWFPWYARGLIRVGELLLKARLYRLAFLCAGLAVKCIRTEAKG